MVEQQSLEPEQIVTEETQAGLIALREELIDMRLNEKIKVDLTLSRHGTPMITLDAGIKHKTEAKNIIQLVQRSGSRDLVKALSKAFPGSESDMDAPGLLALTEFSSSCISEISTLPTQGNELLNSLSNVPSEAVPAYYGSTDGLNFAEVLETIICAQTASKAGFPTYALFDTSGHDSIRAASMTQESISALPNVLKTEYFDFVLSLGENNQERRINSAKLLCGEKSVCFIDDKDVFQKASSILPVGKIVVLGKLAGGDPKLFSDMPLNNVFGAVDRGDLAFSDTIETSKLKPAGFTMYARETVIAAETNGAIIFPFKLTTHANIYKILGRYGSLFSQRKPSGAILCPMQRHRIQTFSQSQKGADPCDVTVIAYLAQKFPESINRLLTDFSNQCKVLEPIEAINLGTKDNRLIIENYFPI